MSTWLFVRHAESVANAEGWLSGHLDVPLSPRGVAQAEALRERLAGVPIDRCLSSDLQRATETLRIALGGRQVPWARSAQLRERHMGVLERMDKARAKAWSREYLERVDLADKASMRLDKLSGGQQQKIQLGVTIMNDPELLILDEPTKGFDPVNRRLLMDIIEDQKLAGATVIMVTHQMEEVERLCDRVILLKDGTSRAYGTVAEVQEQFGGTVYRLTYTGTLPSSALYDIVSAGGGQAELSPRPGGDEAAVLRELIGHGVAVKSFTTARTSLDEVFIKVYGETHDMAEA